MNTDSVTAWASSEAAENGCSVALVDGHAFKLMTYVDEEGEPFSWWECRVRGFGSWQRAEFDEACSQMLPVMESLVRRTIHGMCQRLREAQ